ncbi:hypothetical protein EMA8858_01278 [Emticicia aquatica]|uniref:Uncharacterized protein n=1 Tax=Emticicia aquatica TaxID=1681835 RepID=A0ABM9AMX5_9BACT|nr:hypothetical protein [Emticicia aquatica]CAH0995158.1 hypothetical protein EMA8858_01278 [Emticicia aquatica]
MKNFVFFILSILIINNSLGQSITITPISGVDNEVVKIKKDGIGIDHTDNTQTVRVGTYVHSGGAFIQTHSDHNLNFSTNNGNAQMTLTTSGKVGIGTTTVSANEIMEVNGRMRLSRGTFASGLWFNNSTNGTAITDGAFIGLNNETAGSETAGFWLNGAFRWFVDRNGNTTQNSTTISSLAGTGVRSVSVDANGTLTTTAAQTSYLAVSPASFQPRYNNSGTFTSIGLYGHCYMSNGSTDMITTGINLPSGASITNAELFYINTDNTKRFRFQIQRTGFSSPIFQGVLSDITTTVSSSNNDIKSILFENVVNRTIDNSLYNYLILIYPETTGGELSTWSTSMSIKGVKITYTL